MRGNFHESYTGAEVKPPSDRSTGLLFAVVALIVAWLWRNSEIVPYVAIGLAVVLLAVSLLAPPLLRPVNLLWFRFGLLLHRVVSPVVMFAMFVLVFVPGGAIMRLRSDPMRLKRQDPPPSSYWIEREGLGEAQGSMVNQF
jgi:hypothetical protein